VFIKTIKYYENTNCTHIYLAIHSHSALIFRLRCISIERKKILYLREELQHMTLVRIFFYRTHYEYKSTVHVHVKVWYCKMCIFVILCVDETYYFICVNTVRCNKTTQILYYLCWKVKNNPITLLTFYTTAHKSGCIMVWAETSVILT
jgi:hypothetical protein